MAHRNRWFTELKNGGSFHGYVSDNQRVNPIKPPLNHHYITSKSPRGSLGMTFMSTLAPNKWVIFRQESDDETSGIGYLIFSHTQLSYVYMYIGLYNLYVYIYIHIYKHIYIYIYIIIYTHPSRSVLSPDDIPSLVVYTSAFHDVHTTVGWLVGYKPQSTCGLNLQHNIHICSYIYIITYIYVYNYIYIHL